MKPEISELIEISHYYGKNKDYVIAGGGNTSFKDENFIWVKASGYSLADLDENGIVVLDRKKLQVISQGNYAEEPVLREEQVKNDLFSCISGSGSNKRPSVETSLHDLIRYRFVVHLHPTLINGFLCSRNAKNLGLRISGEKALFVPYTDPGYTLFKRLETEISLYRSRHMQDPQIIFLENHGVFVSADTTGEIRRIYGNIMTETVKLLGPPPEIEQLPYDTTMHRILPVLRILLSTDRRKVVRYRHNTLIAKYYQNQQEYHRISFPLTPDMIVYCKSKYLFIEQSGSADRIMESLKRQIPRFRDEYGYLPKIFVVKNMGVFAVEDSVSSCEAALDVYEDLIKISYYASLLGGTKFLTPEQVEFIDKWEVENYRRKISGSITATSKLDNRIAVITGGAQGFGAGIAAALFAKSVNVVVADLNEESGKKLVSGLAGNKSTNKAVFIKTDVSDHNSVRQLIVSTVSEFGGIDILISNAGVLKAGGLEELEPESFEITTSINYNGYFYCVKYASEIMKIQHEENQNSFADIIQINSKSGLRGSNRNFAYSGSKFGGIGLTQSFALELAPFGIKVNAICPGNYYEGPLWSDPVKGLFVQYLRAGKVPGAKTIEDVRKFYEDQVPLKRGCRLEDVMKAILYIIDQEYETGQAVPVTGGQVMLG